MREGLELKIQQKIGVRDLEYGVHLYLVIIWGVCNMYSYSSSNPSQFSYFRGFSNYGQKSSQRMACVFCC